MLQTFKANLKGNQLEWLDDQPVSINDKPRTVYVIVVEEPSENKSMNKTTLAALKEIENGGGLVFENIEELFKDLSDEKYSTTQFKKDYKRSNKSGKNRGELQKVIYQLAAGKPLDPVYYDHTLLGNYKDCRECHLEPDWLLIYKTEESELALVRTGSHSELF